ncbi:uncharacterized protein LOC122508835 [Leptopilina heterotoma]|uniref:uncharacterized protein LOC122508835 n=1 Tax=Leptopilina heterotoma TaxID=63436 RepID=UPI001CA9BC0E|nr:uncharacterized protein LOC122508835 [Leptopilina heterotoma]
MENNNKENNESVLYTCSYCLKGIGIKETLKKHDCFKKIDFDKNVIKVNKMNCLVLEKTDPKNISRTDEGSKSKKPKIKKTIKGYNLGVVLNKNMSGPLMKCGYCGALLKCSNETLEDLPKIHKCFQDFNEETQGYDLDKNMVIKMVNMSCVEQSLPLSNMDLSDSIIFEVRKRPALYDTKNVPVQERSKLKKKDLWREISCCMNGVLTPEEIESRWIKLRTRYLECRKEENAYIPSGSAAKKKGKTNFPFMKQLTFLNDTQLFDETECSLSSTSSKMKNIENDFQIKLTEQCNIKESEKRIVESFDESVVNVINDLKKKSDGVDGFVTIVRNEIQKLPIAKRLSVGIHLLSFTNDIVESYRFPA